MTTFNKHTNMQWQICRRDVVRFEREQHDNRRALTVGVSIA